jgi:hypothetical protein
MPRSHRAVFLFVSRFRSILIAAAGALLLGGCFLPISTAAPQPARTVGKHAWGFSFSSEIPTLNLIAKGDDQSTDASGDPDDLVAPANSMNLGLQFGLTDHIDLEASVEGAMMIFVVPLPLGVSGGVRVHIIHNDVFDLAVAGRVGHIGLSDSTDSDSGNTDDTNHADATYFAGSGVIQFNTTGLLRPSIALQEMPATIDVDLSGEAPRTYNGAATSLTFALEFVADGVSVTPFIAVTSFDSPDIRSARFVSGGIQLQGRNNRRREATYVPPPPPPPAPPYVPPPPPTAPPDHDAPASTER